MTLLAAVLLIVGLGVLDAYAPGRRSTRVAQGACLLLAAHLLAVSLLIAGGVA